MISGIYLFLLIALCVAVGIVVGDCFLLTPLLTLLFLLAATLSFAVFWRRRQGGVAFVAFLLFFFLIGFVRIQLPPVSLLPNTLLSWSSSISRELSVAVHSAQLSDKAAGLLDAMLFGRRTTLQPAIVSLYRQAGASHLLALSGLHLTIVSGLLFLLMRYTLINRWRYLAGSVGLLLIWGYALLTGFPLSLCRASFMMSLLLIGQMRLTGNNAWHTLGLAAFILLMLNPCTLYDIGFQLSFSAVAGILLFYPLLIAIWRPHNALLRWFWKAFLVSLSAQLAVCPLLLHYFQSPPLSALIFSPFYVLLATLLLYASLLFLLCILLGGNVFHLTMLGSGLLLRHLIEWILVVQHGLMSFAVKLPLGGISDCRLSWTSVVLLYASLFCLLPSFRALREDEQALPYYRIVAFFRTWPYVLTVILLMIAAIWLG